MGKFSRNLKIWWYGLPELRDSGTVRQQQFVSNFANLCNNFIRPKVSERQLVVRSGSYRGLHIGLKFQVNKISQLKRPFRPVLVCLLLMPLLSPQQLLLQELNHDAPLFEPCLKVWDCIGLYHINSQMPWFLTIQNFKWCRVQRSVETSNVPEFSQSEPLLPLIRTSMNKAPKIALQTLINPLCLAISLRMVGYTHPQLGFGHFEQLLP